MGLQRSALETSRLPTVERAVVPPQAAASMSMGRTLPSYEFSPGASDGTRPPEGLPLSWASSELEEVKQEVLRWQEQYQALREQHQTALEELRSSNEELHSVNEELQSTNEELETSKEELQSVNEELHTVNSQLVPP